MTGPRHLFDELRFRLRSLGRRRRFEHDLDDELRFHLEMDIEQRMAAGACRAEAERAARASLGAVESVKEQCRDAWGTRWLDDLRRDLIGAARHLRSERRFSLAAIGSLALGLGAAAVIFSAVDAVLLAPLPFGEPERIVRLYELTPDGTTFSTSDANLLDFAEHGQGLEAIGAISFPNPSPALEVAGERVSLRGLAVTPDFFRVFDVQPVVGRTFDPASMPLGSTPRVAVLAHRAWQRLFAGDRRIAGDTIDLDGETWTVLGVMPPDFLLDDPTVDIFVPYVPDPSLNRGDHRLDAFARLAPGVSRERAEADLADVAAHLGREFPDSNGGWGISLVPIDRILIGDDVRQAGWVLLGAAGLLLLLASVNVCNLLLARASSRRTEMQLRHVLGAGRGRLLRQMLTEYALLATAGGIAGWSLAMATVPVVRTLDLSLPRLVSMAVDARSTLFVVLVTLVAGALFGVLPAWRMAAAAPAATPGAEATEGLRTRAPGGTGRHAGRLRAALVALEVALATVLCVGAGLMEQSVEALRTVDTGLVRGPEADRVLLAQIDLPRDRYPENAPQTRRLFATLMERLESYPGIQSAGATMVSPFRGPQPSNQVGDPAATDLDEFVPVHWRAVSPHTFDALGIPLLRGRGFDDRFEPEPADGGPRPPLEVVISQDLARRLWGHADPLGRDVRWIAPDGPLFRVVGIVAEVRDIDPATAPPPMIYLPQNRIGWPTMTVAVRAAATGTGTDTTPIVAALRASLREVDPLLAFPPLTTLGAQYREVFARPLLSQRLLAAFSLVALLLATLGVYGMVSFDASRRRHETGLRLALGARPAQVIAPVVGRTLGLVATGLVAGLAAAAGLATAGRAILFETAPLDPHVLSSVALLLLTVGAVTSYWPARRAARLDPSRTLRHD